MVIPTAPIYGIVACSAASDLSLAVRSDEDLRKPWACTLFLPCSISIVLLVTPIPWRDLPDRFGDWKIVHQRFGRWAKSGVFERIFRTTSRSVEAMRKIAATITQLDELANDVAVAVREQDSVTQEIAHNANAAAKGTRDVSANVNEVSSSAARTGQVANTVLASAGELAEQSQLLRREVERYLAQVRIV